jgi:Zn-dependent peptidase ImmA (M78 family)
MNDEQDSEADDFAAHLLVPTDSLLRALARLPADKDPEWVVRRLAKRFRVSDLLMAGRLAEEGIRLS